MSEDPIVAERDFLLERALHGDHTWVGVSSDELVRVALDGRQRPRDFPADVYDLARCEETYRRAPEHLRPRMLPTLELFRRAVADGGLWCFECDHGGHNSTYNRLCRPHAEQAGFVSPRATHAA